MLSESVDWYKTSRCSHAALSLPNKCSTGLPSCRQATRRRNVRRIPDDAANTPGDALVSSAHMSQTRPRPLPCTCKDARVHMSVSLEHRPPFEALPTTLLAFNRRPLSAYESFAP